MDRNEVILVGRLSQAAEARPLPSGSTLTTWRLVIRRPERERGAVHDTINCQTFDEELADMVGGFQPGDVVEVVGALRRRFFTGRHGKANTHEVVAQRVRLLERKVTVTYEEDTPVTGESPAPPEPSPVAEVPVQRGPRSLAFFLSRQRLAARGDDGEGADEGEERPTA